MNKMNLDFNFLSMEDREKAINNAIMENGIVHLTYVLSRGDYDIYGWFKFNESPEGVEYWVNLRNKYASTLESVLQN